MSEDNPASPATGEVSVRQATLADLELLVPLFDAYRQFYRQPSNEDLARRFFEDRLAHHESIVFIALESNASALGFTQLFPSFSSASAARLFILNDLFVVPAARRKQVASWLLRAAANFARQAGAVRITLSTEVTNHAAQALYEAEGWRRQTDFCAYNLSLI